MSLQLSETSEKVGDLTVRTMADQELSDDSRVRRVFAVPGKARRVAIFLRDEGGAETEVERLEVSAGEQVYVRVRVLPAAREDRDG